MHVLYKYTMFNLIIIHNVRSLLFVFLKMLFVAFSHTVRVWTYEFAEYYTKIQQWFPFDLQNTMKTFFRCFLFTYSMDNCSALHFAFEIVLRLKS